jgi:sirohydrochlorin cobaltochelatase
MPVPPSRPTTGVLLFAHGARDARWADPFRAVAERVRADAPALPLELAFLEFMPPDLPEAARRLAAAGVTRIEVVPLFFGPGGHLRSEVPALAAAARAGLPGVTIEIAAAAGVDPGVVAALADYALRCAGARRPR